ncbi:unnamed protein product, partial [Rotaria sp. Silwood1]
SIFINNSYSIYTLLLAYICCFSNTLSLSVFFIAFGSLCGWIYVAIDIVFRHQHYIDFIKWSIVSGLITLIPLTLID